MIADASATERLDRHHREFHALLATAAAHLDRGRLEATAAYAQLAGQYAWMNHTGAFASAELEQLLAALGATLPAPRQAASRTPDPREVLHVVTQCYGTGGSTQAIACWIEQDQGRRHRVCITRQRGAPPPEKIVAPLQAPGDLIRLDARRGGLMERAAHLRELAATADAVVLHLHPYDVIPAIALSGTAELPPVSFVDHADHVFWVGTGISDVVMHMRDSGRRLAAARRGLPAERSAVVARPLRPTERATSREDAKRALGIEPGQVLLVTAADGTKYRPVGSPGFLDLLVATLERHPDAVLLAAGPAPDEVWQAASARTGGRIRALGMLPDVRGLQEAADVYVDSYPFSSLTSLLEAGSLGVPAVTFRGHPEDCGVLGADTRGVDEHILTPATLDAFVEELGGLIVDAQQRRHRGERTMKAIRDTHTAPGWPAAVAGLYAQAAALQPPAGAAEVGRRAERVDVLVDLVMQQTGYAQGVPGVTRDLLAFLPLPERAGAWWRLTRAGRRPPNGNLLPEWLLSRLWSHRQTAHRALAALRR